MKCRRMRAVRAAVPAYNEFQEWTDFVSKPEEERKVSLCLTFLIRTETVDFRIF